MPDLGCGMQDLLWDHSANHSSIAACRVPWTEEPGRLQSMGSESDTTEWARDHWTSQVARVVKNPPANAGDARDPSLIPGSGRSSGVGNGNTLQYSCLGNSMNRGDWWATVHRVPELDTTKWLNTHTHRLICCTVLNLHPVLTAFASPLRCSWEILFVLLSFWKAIPPTFSRDPQVLFSLLPASAPFC